MFRVAFRFHCPLITVFRARVVLIFAPAHKSLYLTQQTRCVCIIPELTVMSSSSLTTDAALADRSVLLLGITAFLHKNPRL